LINQPLSERYAKALFNLGAKENKLQEWLESLLNLNDFINQNSKLYDYFTSPILSSEKQEATFINLFKPYLSPEPFNFILVLLRKRRFKELNEIMRLFKKMVFEKLGLLQGLITTPFPLNANEKESLVNEWSKILNKKIVLDEAIDPTLIGGGVLSFENKRIDFSLKGKLQKLQNNLSRNERS
jgi:F-type H+-transporting ATPase subunit delta